MKPFAWLLSLVSTFAVASLPAQSWTCIPAHGKVNGIPLSASTTYNAERAGWDLQRPPGDFTAKGCSSGNSFFFSAPLPEGNYDVTVEVGGARESVTTVKAEARRPMLVRVASGAGRSRIGRFTVNIRRPRLADGSEVKRKPREIGSLDWDDKLTLEFAGTNPSLRRLTVRPAPAATPTIFLAGDSTVTDQDLEPWAAWGQMLPAFLGPGVAVANHAESGETLRSFTTENRFAKIFSQLTAGDYLFLQFGHNDQKPGSGNVSPAQYTAMLHDLIARARAVGATPVLVTPMNRRTFDAEGHLRDTLAPYPQLVRDLAAQEHVALIDLNAFSQTLYEQLGPVGSIALFVYAPANTYPNQPEALHDDTHFNSYGAWELARGVVSTLQQQRVPLTRWLREPKARFNPHRPDPPATVRLPSTPFTGVEKPYER